MKAADTAHRNGMLRVVAFCEKCAISIELSCDVKYMEANLHCIGKHQLEKLNQEILHCPSGGTLKGPMKAFFFFFFASYEINPNPNHWSLFSS